MSKTATLPPLPMTAASEIEEMTATVLLIGEWLIKQQQQFKQQQRLLEEKQRQIEAQQKQIEELNEQLDKLKNRSSKNSSVPPSSDQLKKPSDKSKPNDCFSAYNPQSAAAKQKCLTHLERDLEALKASRFVGNREFAEQVSRVLRVAGCIHRDYHLGKLSQEAITNSRLDLESQLQAVLEQPVAGGLPSDAQRLANRIKGHWDDWFTFLTHPQVKPDNNDAQRPLRPIVVHRKVSGGARSDWGDQLVAQMFSLLETMRLQGRDVSAQLCELLSLAGRSPPSLQPS